MGMGTGMGRAKWLFDEGPGVDAIGGWVVFLGYTACVEKDTGV